MQMQLYSVANAEKGHAVKSSLDSVKMLNVVVGVGRIQCNNDTLRAVISYARADMISRR